jgi:hypothetical protein
VGVTWTNGASYLAPTYAKAANGRWYLMSNINGTATVQPTHTSGTVTGADGLAWQHLGTGDAEIVKISALVYEVSETFDVPSIANAAFSAERTISIPGAQVGDICEVTYDGDPLGLVFFGRIHSAGSGRYKALNLTGASVDLPSGVFHFRARPKIT